MKTLITIYNLDRANDLLTYADGLVVGIKGFSTRETSYLNQDELKQLSELTKKRDKNLYISLKPMLHNHMIKPLKAFLESIKDVSLTGFIIGDIGYYELLKEMGFDHIVYNPETLLSNTYDLNVYFEYGIEGAFISKEISLFDIKEMIKNKKNKLFMVGHGYLNMFYSRRPLIKSYLETISKDYDYKVDTLRIKEETREVYHPIIEDDFGTHVYRSEVTTTLDIKEELKGLDYLLIDTIFHDDDYGIRVLKLYEDFTEEAKRKLEEDYKETWDTGFLYLNTIYKQG